MAAQAKTPAPPQTDTDIQALETATNAEQSLPQGGQQDYVDTLVDVLGTQAESVTDEWLQQIRAEVVSATDFDDLLGRLSVLMTDLPLDTLGELIAGASAAADRAGRADAEGEFRA